MNLQFITHRTARFDEVEGARLALAGGCRSIQLRMKEAEKARVLKPMCHAVGVHLGKNDMPIAEVRSVLGADYIIGGITFEEIPAIMQTGVSDIALSGTILQAQNPTDKMRQIINKLTEMEIEI